MICIRVRSGKAFCDGNGRVRKTVVHRQVSSYFSRRCMNRTCRCASMIELVEIYQHEYSFDHSNLVQTFPQKYEERSSRMSSVHAV